MAKSQGKDLGFRGQNDPPILVDSPCTENGGGSLVKVSSLVNFLVGRTCDGESTEGYGVKGTASQEEPGVMT